jgi:hypothetical protein
MDSNIHSLHGGFTFQTCHKNPGAEKALGFKFASLYKALVLTISYPTNTMLFANHNDKEDYELTEFSPKGQDAKSVVTYTPTTIDNRTVGDELKEIIVTSIDNAIASELVSDEMKPSSDAQPNVQNVNVLDKVANQSEEALDSAKAVEIEDVVVSAVENPESAVEEVEAVEFEEIVVQSAEIPYTMNEEVEAVEIEDVVVSVVENPETLVEEFEAVEIKEMVAAEDAEGIIEKIEVAELEIIHEVSKPETASVDGDSIVSGPTTTLRERSSVSTIIDEIGRPESPSSVSALKAQFASFSSHETAALAASSVSEAVFRTNPILIQVQESLDALMKNEAVQKEFDVKDFALTNEQGLALASTLEKNNVVEKLNLANAGLQNKIVIEIAKSLAKNSSVKYLRLEGNQIGPSGMVALAQCLTTNDTLQEIYLGNQKSITSTGTKAEGMFASALARNTSLMKLSLEIRSFACRDRIDRAISRNKEIARKARMQ